MSVQDTNTFRSYIDERIAIEFVCKAFNASFKRLRSWNVIVFKNEHRLLNSC